MKKRSKPDHRKGRLGHKTKMVRQCIRAVCGFTEYEKRIMELLK